MLIITHGGCRALQMCAMGYQGMRSNLALGGRIVIVSSDVFGTKPVFVAVESGLLGEEIESDRDSRMPQFGSGSLPPHCTPTLGLI